MRRTIVTSTVRVVGELWQPGFTAAMDYPLRECDLHNMIPEGGTVADITREEVASWLDRHAGDFSRIVDFAADISSGPVDVVLDFATENGEMAYCDAMYRED